MSVPSKHPPRHSCEGKNLLNTPHKLVYFEQFEDIQSAITPEKRLKVWKRDWKNRFVDKMNSWWIDLYFDLKW